MPWNLVQRRLNAFEIAAERPLVEYGDVDVGQFWYAPWLLTKGDGARIGKNYLTDWVKLRPPLVIKLFCGHAWCPDEMACDKTGFHGNGWKVTGEAPKFTCQPSINVVGIYHGWITDGVISDDLDGHKYDQKTGSMLS